MTPETAATPETPEAPLEVVDAVESVESAGQAGQAPETEAGGEATAVQDAGSQAAREAMDWVLDDGAVLEGVLAGARALIAAVPADLLHGPTPCPEYDVQTLIGHMVSWLRMFDAGFAGQSDADPAALGPGPDPAADFAEAGASVLRHWRDGGPQASVPVTGSPLPGPFVYRMMVSEYLIHGWDLAVATGQAVPFSAEQAEFALAGLRGMLLPQYRGEIFGAEVPVPEDAGAVDKVVAFAGRDPGWTAPPDA